MTFNQIKYFVACAQTLNFTVAAREMYVSQQVVSQSISNLEKEIGIKLFERTTKYVRLTPAGELLYRNWEKFLADFSQSIDAARLIQKACLRDIRIGIPNLNKVLNIIKPRLSCFIADYPDFNLDCSIESLSTLNDLILSGEVDAIVTLTQEMPEFGEKYRVETIEGIKDELIFSVRHPLAKKVSLNMRDIDNRVLYLLSDKFSHIARDRILGILKECEITPSEIALFNSVHSLELALYKGEGVAIAPRLFFDDTENDLCFHTILGIPPQETEMVIAWHVENENENLEILVDYIAMR